MDLELRHLQVVVAVAEHGGYTAAAEQMHLAQSSLSRTVQDVERRVGVPLFDRSTRLVVPTPEGIAFLDLARRVLEEFDRAMAHFDGYLRGQRGSVVVAALPSLAATLLPPVLRAYRALRPEISVEVRDGLSGHVLDLVCSGVVDLALTVVDDVPTSLAAVPVARDRFSCLVAPSHPWSGRSTVSWAELADEPFVAFDRSSSVRLLSDQALAEGGVRLGPTTEASNIGAVTGLVAADLGVSAAPGLVLPLMAFGGLAVLDLVDPVVEREICLLHDPRRPTTPAVRALVEMLRGAADYGIVLPHGARWVHPA